MRTCTREGCGNTFEPRTVKHKYCSHQCLRWHEDMGPAKPSTNRPRETYFVGVDGEGITRGSHEYVLLGVGDEQREWPNGVRDITEIFSFLYDQYEKDAIYAGFFLGYDFNMWLRLLPRERAWMLLSDHGQRKRARKSEGGQRLGPFPVAYKDWEFDLLASKRFKLRPRVQGAPWMYICDSGPFFQTSLLRAVDPKEWREPIISEDEYKILEEGKKRRASAVLDDEMKFYNRLENDVFARLMTHLRTGLAHADVKLKKQQWFGPGQAAQAWMRRVGTLERVQARIKKLPKALTDAAIATYYGGWFELAIHGHIPGVTYEYDINSAYPHVSSQLPCLCGTWRHGTGRPPKTYALCMVYVIARGKDRYLGGLPYRREDGRVCRPRWTKGWYWNHELQAARRAGLVSEATHYEWWAYEPCGHPPPMAALKGLYESRLRIGKDTPEGKAFKLVYNSTYGKNAQSEGEPVYGNPFYASLITAGCRTAILGAIASHPDKSAAVAMVATDGVYFLSQHPGLHGQVSERLGDWSLEERHNITLFKPGVYWDDAARDRIARGESPRFKSRGVNARDFAASIGEIDAWFSRWGEDEPTWPTVEFKAAFAQVSVRQALQWTEEIEEVPKRNAVFKRLAGHVMTDRTLHQDASPDVKRNPRTLVFDGRVWRTEPWDGGPHWGPSAPYEKRFGLDDEDFTGFVSPDGPTMLEFRAALGVG